jgi:hypothetical protein
MTNTKANAHLEIHTVEIKTPSRPQTHTEDWHRHRLPIVFDGVAICAVALIPWMIVLGFTLPGRYEVNHWEPTWVGFDAILVLGFASTAWAIRQQRPVAMLFAVVTGTLLAADAWFDILTATGSGVVLSIGTAALVELPLAAWLFYSAGRVFSQALESAREMARAVAPGNPVRPIDGPGTVAEASQ